MSAPHPGPAAPPAPTLDALVHNSLARMAGGISPITLALGGMDWALHLAASPQRRLQLAAQALADARRGLLPAGAGADAGSDADGRFSDPAWDQWPYSSAKAWHQAAQRWWQEASQVDGMSRHHQHVLQFYARQALDALSPSNALLSNPEVLRTSAQTLGMSLLQGLQNYWSDVQAAQQRSAPGREAAPAALPYTVGKDVATTPGRVVYRNHLIELLHYTPSTAQVFAQPLLIVPSCIMKYYILDLSPHNSMVRYLVGKGHSVYMISWRNPDASDRALGMQDYLQSGVMDAMRAVRAHSGSASLNAMGYCLGGTFLAIVAAAMGRHAQLKRAAPGAGQPAAPAPGSLGDLPTLGNVSLLAAQTDFSEPGELGVFIDDDQLRTLRESMARTGYLSGRQMAASFQFLNARDLIWTHGTRRYLLGKDEVGNDMMSWNADLTRLPERMHNEYLSSLFLNNALAEGHYRVGDMGVALMDIQAPLLVVGTQRDHVSPWRSVYKIHLLTDTPTTFILASGGHNAGIVSEPGHAHRSYQVAHTDAGQPWVEPEAWAAATPVQQGSWWEALHAWLAQRSGALVAAPAQPQGLGAAPGEYVLTRYDD